jgi:hypothetical protein
MKTLLLAAAAAALTLAAFSPALADGGNDDNGGNGGNGSGNGRANRATVTGTGQLTVFQPITLTQTQGLDFGAITSGAAGTVAIAQTTGARSVGGGVGALAVNVGKAGAFAVYGQQNAAINVVVGASITGFAGGLTGVTAATGLPTVLTGNTATFNVGGVLNIPANTPAGAYVGAYTVAVNYP